jgi:hypothetical protein
MNDERRSGILTLLGWAVITTAAYHYDWRLALLVGGMLVYVESFRR